MPSVTGTRRSTRSRADHQRYVAGRIRTLDTRFGSYLPLGPLITVPAKAAGSDVFPPGRLRSPPLPRVSPSLEQLNALVVIPYRFVSGIMSTCQRYSIRR